MKLQLDNYTIISDAYNFILLETKMKGSKPYETTLGYYGTLEATLEGCLKYRLRSSTATDLKQVIALIKDVETKLVKILKEIKD